MPSDNRRAPLDRMRERAREQVEKTSLRNVAADVGIAYNTLNRFINGAKPRKVSMRRLEAWYEEEASEVERLRRELAEVRKRLAACEAKLGKR